MNLQICANVASLRCIIVVRLVISRIAPVHIRRTVDCRTRSKARLNTDSILCIGWVIDFREIVINHVRRLTGRAAFVLKTSTILYLSDLKASPPRRDFERVANTIDCKMKWLGEPVLGGQLGIQIGDICDPFDV